MLGWYDKQNAESLLRIAEAMKEITETIADMECSLADIRFSLSFPGSLTLKLLEKNMTMISFKVVLPQLTVADVVRRELTIQIAGQPPAVETLDATATESANYSSPQNAPVHLSLTDIDDVGNRSEASVLDAVLVDVFPPAKPGDCRWSKPGELSLVEIGESNP